MDEYAEEKKTEKNLIVRSGISEAETTNKKDCAQCFVLKLYSSDVNFFQNRNSNPKPRSKLETRFLAAW